MNGVHDIGGMHGFGAVVPEQDEPVFHEPWEGRVYVMQGQLNTKFPPQQPGANRDIVERIEPARYLAISYYERFLEVLEKRALAEGIISAEELENRMKLIEKEGGDPVAPRTDPEAARAALTRLKTRQLRPHDSSSPPRFALGDEVLVRNLNWQGHNRLPRYIRGKGGVIERVNGAHRIEDAHADALGPNPQVVYTVRFDGPEVWGPECEANLKVYVELWEGYLEPANASSRRNT